MDAAGRRRSTIDIVRHPDNDGVDNPATNSTLPTVRLVLILVLGSPELLREFCSPVDVELTPEPESE